MAQVTYSWSNTCTSDLVMHSALLPICLVTLMASFSLQAAISHAPIIDSVQYDNPQRVVVLGKRFDDPCRECEVRVRYSRSLRYSAPIRDWQPTRIEIELPDLNQNDAVIQIQIRRDKTASQWKSLKLRRNIALLSKKSRAHSLGVGEKGEEKFTIPSTQTHCGKAVSVYDHAELSIKKKRFADAVIVESPPSGCERCSPVVVRWYNEPTGYISYELKVFGRTVQGVCDDRVRRGF